MPNDQDAWVLTLPAVRWAIEELRNRRIHNFFPGYLQVRKRAAEDGRLDNIAPNVNEIGPWLRVDGGPPGRPYYRPMMDAVGTAASYWLNQNLAGSFAPSSLRAGQPPTQVLEPGRGVFTLKPDHWNLARQHLLHDEPVFELALAAFYFRNMAFVSAEPPTLVSLSAALRSEFLINADEAAALFGNRNGEYRDLHPGDDGVAWFERWVGPLAVDPDFVLDPDSRVSDGLHLVRSLDADDLGIGGHAATEAHRSNRPDDVGAADDDPVIAEIVDLLRYHGGVLLSGPPGTSKTWYAAEVARVLSDGDETRRDFVQFHQSYQYENFVQGFAPKPSGDGFEMRDGHFVRMCRAAAARPDDTFVLVIDEFSRADVGRVFGEALTYMDGTKRGMGFTLASGDPLTVPPNLKIIATMNPLDRGVDEVDAAFERRFAKVTMGPSRATLDSFLTGAGVEEPLRAEVLNFFSLLNRRAVSNPALAIGHAYFLDVVDVGSFKRVWDYQVRHVVDRAYALDPIGAGEVNDEWFAILDRLSSGPEPGVDEG